MPFFQKRPVTIEARQYTGDSSCAARLVSWITSCNHQATYDDPCDAYPQGLLSIKTLEGDHLALPQDWIIRGVRGEFYPCKPEVFAETYKQV